MDAQNSLSLLSDLVESKPLQMTKPESANHSTQSSVETAPLSAPASPSAYESVAYNTLARLQQGHSNINVFLVRDETGDLFAQKVRTLSTRNPQLKLEFEMMTQLDHRNIVRGFKYSLTDYEESILMEYCAGGDLQKLISTRKLLPETDAKQFFRPLAEAIAHCHRHNVAHLDIKPENCFLTFSGALKLGDFGFAQSAEKHIKPCRCGTYCYNSPEIRMQLPFDGKAADIFSLGVLLFQLVTGYRPFAQADGKSREFKKWLENKVDFWREAELKLERALFITVRFSTELKTLVTAMMELHPRNRPTIEEVLGSPWLGKE